METSVKHGFWGLMEEPPIETRELSQACLIGVYPKGQSVKWLFVEHIEHRSLPSHWQQGGHR